MSFGEVCVMCKYSCVIDEFVGVEFEDEKGGKECGNVEGDCVGLCYDE